MNDEKLNICQVSLARDISLVKENYFNFISFYKNSNFFLICPKKDYNLFKSTFNFNNFNIINEDEILPFEKFKNIFFQLSKNISYKKDFQKRLSWYYQQVLKLSKEKIIIWDADTVILRKIKFFDKHKSNNFGTLFEFHKAYYLTIKKIFGTLPTYFVSSLTQFAAISAEDNRILWIKLNNYLKKNSMNTAEWISTIILKSVFEEHEIYNGSMFSEYELIGLSKF